MTTLATSTIGATDLHTLLASSAEFALLDVREARVTAEKGSILLGVAVPLSSLELRIDGLVPRRSTPVIVYDGGENDDLAERAAARLSELGYTDVKILDGGLRAWADAGFKVQFGGDHVIGQAFGEWIEAVYDTPHISVPDYLAKVAAGDDVVLLDSRPIGEFGNHSLPGGTSIPGAELVYRAAGVVTSPDSLVVVHCAGRTRSILGAQVLINAGLPNRVVALEGGTQSWVLEGHELEHGKHSAALLPSGAALDDAHAAAGRIRDRFGIRSIDKATLARFRSETDHRSLYVLDVRPPEEFEAGHLAETVSAPSWDVAPWVFRYIATHNGRIVLVDNDGVRATVAASWIEQVGWGEVYVLTDAFAGEQLETGAVARVALDEPDAVESITPAALQTLLNDADSITVLDLQPSFEYKQAHIPGAAFAIRSHLAGSADSIPGDGTIVLTSDDGLLARYAARDLSGVTSRPVRALAGGTAAWREAGLPLESDNQSWLHDADDAVSSGWRETDPERRKAAFRHYLAWELGLVAELDVDDTVPFKRFSSPGAAA
ncbi:rhodanese-like domain-containing protein [Frankia tisae]|uniref:rhodanese-like domain-containing protein n=1 Tax=Frankia tisae TaxID=2950104 RepID=UPI0021BEB84E|nr:rhodanese-like domain-containing protein [Frankia tisae]